MPLAQLNRSNLISLKQDDQWWEIMVFSWKIAGGLSIDAILFSARAYFFLASGYMSYHIKHKSIGINLTRNIVIFETIKKSQELADN